jgi:RHS repeat-associated protein
VFYVFYDIWGNIEAKTLDWLPFAYTGKELDAESGLYYFGARYYSPDIGRFITEDPVKGVIELPQTLNPYPLCINNPAMYVDPNGEFWGVLWGVLGAAAESFVRGRASAVFGGMWLESPEVFGLFGVWSAEKVKETLREGDIKDLLLLPYRLSSMIVMDTLMILLA